MRACVCVCVFERERERETETETDRRSVLSGEVMTGEESLCGGASFVEFSASHCGQQALLNLTLGQALNGAEANLVKKQLATNLVMVSPYQPPKADPPVVSPPGKVQVITEFSSGNISSGGPVAVSGCRQVNVSSGSSDMQPINGKHAGAPDMEVGMAENLHGRVDLALSMVPYTEPVTEESNAGCLRPYATLNPVVSRHLARRTADLRPDPEVRMPDSFVSDNVFRQPPTPGVSPSYNINRYVNEQCLAQHNDAYQAPRSACLDPLVLSNSAAMGECLAQPTASNPALCSACLDPLGLGNSAAIGECLAQPMASNPAPINVWLASSVSHGRVSREQSFPVPLSTFGKNTGGKKKQLTDLPLPDSLARSFDSSEMDKITKAIVRVNEFGSPVATDNTSKQGNIPAFAQQPDEGREFGGFKKSTPRVLPSVGAFTVQCAKCFKWRLVPSKEQYEQIRQQILEKPFFCSSTSIWQPGASCDDPPEICEDKNFVWAIDKPNIPLAPSGWERLLVIRSEGCSKFADIYYVSPSGRKLRSMPDIERYLSEHPELVDAGVHLSQFSFVIPRALDENYCRKKTPSTVMRGSITNKSSPAHNLGVRSQPLKVPFLRRFPTEHVDQRDFTGLPLECRQPATGQSSVNCPENTPLTIQPLRAWDPDNHAMMLACHAGVGLGSSVNARLH